MTNKMNSALLCDGYKLSHNKMYPEGTTLVFSNFTPRNNKYAPKACQDTGVVVFGIQLMLKQIHEHFEKNFFKREQIKKEVDFTEKYGYIVQNEYHNRISAKIKKEVISEIKTELDLYLGGDYDVTHFEELWDLGYLPVKVKALPEGIETNPNIPHMTFVNKDGISWDQLREEDNLLTVKYLDGKFYNETTLTEIRNTINNGKN
jgi:nicotinamide phosphoribosyltransferase